MQQFMLAIKSEVTPNAFEFLLSYQFQLLDFLDASHNTAKKKMAHCFCPCWARGGRMLMSLCSIQLVKPFAASLDRAAIFIMVLNLIFIVLFLQTCCWIPSFSICLTRHATYLSVNSFFRNLCLFWTITADVFFIKHVRTGSLKIATAVAECFPVLCMQCEHTSLESRRIHMEISTFHDETYRKSQVIAPLVFFSCRKCHFL